MIEEIIALAHEAGDAAMTYFRHHHKCRQGV